MKNDLRSEVFASPELEDFETALEEESGVDSSGGEVSVEVFLDFDLPEDFFLPIF